MESIYKINFTPVFVVGAPRSGTHLLATSLARNLDCVYRNEINEYWKSFHPFLKTDYIPESKATLRVINKHRRNISELIKKHGEKKFYLEKTASNALRLYYIKKVFPEAIIIHIIRDGRASAYSIKKQYFGNINKITQFEGQEKQKGNRLTKMGAEVKRRLVKGFNPLLLITNFRRYWKTGLMRMGFLKYSSWGPRYPGYEYKARYYEPVELAGDQWLTMVAAAKNFGDNSNDCFECRYEKLIEEPEINLRNLIEIISGENIKGNIEHEVENKKVKDSFNNMNNAEMTRLNEIIGIMQKYLKYE